jgi:hypothetical protein
MSVELDKSRVVKAFVPAIDMLDMYSKILREMASVEKTEGKRIDELLKEVISYDSLIMLSKKMTPELYTQFITALLRLSTISIKAPNPLILPSEEKEKLASEIDEIVLILKKVFSQLKEI